jgi:hypothetical protein
VNQFVEADFEMAGDGGDFAGALSGHFGKEWIQRRGDKEAFGGRAVRHGVAIGHRRAFGRKREVEENGGLLNRKAEG